MSECVLIELIDSERDESADEYIVEAVTGHRLVDDGYEYRVKWHNWDAPGDDTWEPLANLEHAPIAVSDYAAKVRPVIAPGVQVDARDALDDAADATVMALAQCLLATRHQAATTVKYELDLSDLHSVHEDALRTWEAHMNDVCRAAGEATVSVVNEVDACGPPDAFQFVADYVYHSEVAGNLDLTYKVHSCHCDNNCVVECAEPSAAKRFRSLSQWQQRQRSGSDAASSTSSGSEETHSGREAGGGAECCQRSELFDTLRLKPGAFVYDEYGRLRAKYLTHMRSIIECNSQCGCDASLCPSRVVQRRRQVPLTIFRTKNRGWGVRADDDIAPGTFVGCYVGEVITSELAERRSHEQKAHSNGVSYVYDLDHIEDNPPYVVDAMYHGNVTHFFNHSCSPNIRVHNVWTECQLQVLPTLAFFTCRFVPRGKELAFDYSPASGIDDESTEDSNSSPSKQQHHSVRQNCKCGSTKCRGQVWL